MPPGLWIVATPIGNLGDLSERARQALEEADRILCEDTRRTSQLLSVLGLSKSMDRLDAHATDAKLERVVEAMLEGRSYALVTDAGTPAVSDPGARIVKLARDAGVRITPVPGASAVMALLSVSGLDETAFCFRGFFPRKSKERAEELTQASSSQVSRVFVWFEAPGRIEDAIDAVATFAPDCQIVAGKELTKLHEKLLAGSACEVSSQLKAELKLEGERGEWCFVVRFAALPERSAQESSDWVKALRCLIDEGVSPSNSARKVSQIFDIAKKIVYEMALSLKDKDKANNSDEGG